jgi:hypothetical protein
LHLDPSAARLKPGPHRPHNDELAVFGAIHPGMLFLMQVPSMLASEKNMGGVQVAQLFGPGSGKQEAHGKEH